MEQVTRPKVRLNKKGIVLEVKNPYEREVYYDRDGDAMRVNPFVLHAADYAKMAAAKGSSDGSSETVAQKVDTASSKSTEGQLFAAPTPVIVAIGALLLYFFMSSKRSSLQRETERWLAS